MAGGGITVFRLGSGGGGIESAVEYALEGGCDAEMLGAGVEGASAYADGLVRRFSIEGEEIAEDELDEEQLRAWISGIDPVTGETRGRRKEAENAHLFYDLGVTAQKTYSLAGVLHPKLKAELDALMDRIGDAQIGLLHERLEARAGAGGKNRVGISRLEVVKLSHEASRSLDPHRHEHLWINAKVLCEDGKWRALDSTQLMTMSTLLNAKRAEMLNSDVQWREALARFGYTLNADGEIAELAHAAGHMSKRNAQIRANVAKLEREWREANPGKEPSAKMREMWDRRAWAMDRPAKDEAQDPETWVERIRAELADLDPALLEHHDPAGPVVVTAAEDIDVEVLIENALEELNARAQRHQDRVSLVDIEAMAVQALADTCAVLDPREREELCEQIRQGVLEQCELLTDVDLTDIPSHVRVLRAREVGEARREVIGRAAVRSATMHTDALSEDALVEAVASVKTETEERGERFHDLNEEQIEAVRAIGGKASLVTVEGPAGAGKTTMLTVAERALRAHGQCMHVFAPAKNAALVAEMEIGGVTGNSLHSLLRAHGYTWQDEQGHTVWEHTTPARIPERFDLDARDVIVVDEAGMIDMHAMRALMQVADKTGAKVVLVGDPEQITPVGHAGGMGLIQNELPEDAKLTLGQVHRFRNADGTPNTTYADFSLRLRTATTDTEAEQAATWLAEHGHITPETDRTIHIERMAREWMHHHGKGDTVALMASRNEDVDQINTLVQAARVRAGQLPRESVMEGARGQDLHVGDFVRSVRNAEFSNGAEVANGETWRIEAVRDGRISLRGGRDERQITVPVSYAPDLRLSYASTLHAAQGRTVTHALTLMDETTSAEALYVGMTRGKRSNALLVEADTVEGATQRVHETITNRTISLSEDELRARVSEEIQRAGKARENEHRAKAERERAAKLEKHGFMRLSFIDGTTSDVLLLKYDDDALYAVDLHTLKVSRTKRENIAETAYLTSYTATADAFARLDSHYQQIFPDENTLARLEAAAETAQALQEAKAEGTLASLTSQLQKTRLDITNATSELDDLALTEHTSRQELHRVKDTLDELNNRRTPLMPAARKAHRENIETTTARLDHYTQKLETTREKIEATRTRLESLTATENTLTATHESETERIDQLTRTLAEIDPHYETRHPEKYAQSLAAKLRTRDYLEKLYPRLKASDPEAWATYLHRRYDNPLAKYLAKNQPQQTPTPRRTTTPFAGMPMPGPNPHDLGPHM